ncbi:MAG TPA: heme ABC exporter ATP-binding protein CcmA [candidate division Zixibacteria bacterium]|nr:heme ABC exporter ATP-binding protein CcmA [candidate division Zixibacteria bacterium]
MPQTTIYSAPRTGQHPPPPAVATDQLARLFGRSAALAGVSLRVEPGRVVALLGPNGAGKTTLLRILATSLHPSFGVAAIHGLDVAHHAHAVRQMVAYLPHATGLYDDLTAAENLAFAATLRRLPDAEDRARRALAAVGLTHEADRRVRGFSAGMRRRLALARLLLADAPVLLLDEPHAALDAEGMALVDRLLAGWREEGRTVLVASHQAQRITPLAHGWARLDGGLLVEVGGEGVTGEARSAGRLPEPVGAVVER